MDNNNINHNHNHKFDVGGGGIAVAAMTLGTIVFLACKKYFGKFTKGDTSIEIRPSNSFAQKISKNKPTSYNVRKNNSTGNYDDAS
jgi:hypothetical protein